MIGTADRQVHTDHVVRARHERVQSRWASMVASTGSHPAQTSGACLFDGYLRCTTHDEMAHAVIAVEQSGGRVIFDHADAGIWVNPTLLDSADILSKAEDPVILRTTCICCHHQFGGASSVVRTQVAGCQDGGDEPHKLGGLNPHGLWSNRRGLILGPRH